MYGKLKESIWIQMKHSKGLSESDRELYIFGFIQGAILLLNILTSLCIGIALDMLLEVVIYMVCFIPLRIFAGGYHAKTQLRCYIMSSFATVFVLLGIRFLQDYNGMLEWIMLLISTVVIWELAPVEDANKPLSFEDQLAYQKKTRSSLVLFFGFMGLFYMLDDYRVISTIEAVFCFLAIVLLMGQFKNRFRRTMK